MYNHGITIKEESTVIPSSVNNGDLHVVFGTAPINKSENPYSVTNKPVIVNSFNEAQLLFGYSENELDKYTLCQAMIAYFKMQSIAPVCFINILDPVRHATAFSETLTIVNGEATITNTGVLIDSISVVLGEDTLTAETDYTVSFLGDNAVITFIGDTKGEVTVTGNALDVSKVTDSDIVGGYDSTTGVRTGLEIIRNIYPKLGRSVSIFTVPGYSSNPVVADAMQLKTTEINGMFSCETIIDINATRYDQVESVKEESGITSEHAIAVWPKVKIEKLVIAYSVVLAAVIAATDSNNNDIPYVSPSNKELEITELCDASGNEIVIDKPIADELNGIGVVTAINMNGFRTWGNNTAAYPHNDDPKDRWIACRRFFTWNENRFASTYFAKLDAPLSPRLIENILNEENQYCGAMVANGYCAAASIELDSDTDILSGKISFLQLIAPYIPAEQITNKFSFDVNALLNSLDTGEV